MAKLFAKDKFNLILVSRGEDKLRTTASLLEAEGIEVITISKDLFEINGAGEVDQEITARGLQVDVLVNDAGQGMYGKFIKNELSRELDISQCSSCTGIIRCCLS